MNFRSPQDAQNMGIGTVFQEIALCPNLTVAENMFIGRSRDAFVNWKQMNQRAAEMLDSWGFPQVPPRNWPAAPLPSSR